MPLCPLLHDSSSLDYCDECGRPMAGSSPIAAPCPQCQTPRESGARFCEICQHDFQPSPGPASDSRRVRSESLAAKALGLPTPAAATPARAEPPAFEAPLLARVQADPALCEDEADRRAFPPGALLDRIFHLDLDENLVGRDSASKQSHPEIALDDAGASRRHLKLVRLDGRFHALELGSSNGTLLDGQPLSPGVPAPVGPGSELRLGLWTRILIQSRAPRAIKDPQ